MALKIKIKKEGLLVNKWSMFLMAVIFSLTVRNLPAIAADQSSEVERLKDEIQKIQEQYKTDMQRLFNRIEELEKKQAETESQNC